jgi:RNA polymerase sigma-70 factor (ECF subfamily)
MNDPAEADLPERLQNALGRPPTHAVVDRHFDAVVGFLARRVGPDIAQDLAQETFTAQAHATTPSELDPELFAGLTSLARRDRDALLLHVWGELS